MGTLFVTHSWPTSGAPSARAGNEELLTARKSLAEAAEGSLQGLSVGHPPSLPLSPEKPSVGQSNPFKSQKIAWSTIWRQLLEGVGRAVTPFPGWAHGCPSATSAGVMCPSPGTFHEEFPSHQQLPGHSRTWDSRSPSCSSLFCSVSLGPSLFLDILPSHQLLWQVTPK